MLFSLIEQGPHIVSASSYYIMRWVGLCREFFIAFGEFNPRNIINAT